MKFLMTYAQKPDVPPPSPEQLAKIGALTERNMKSGVVVMTGGLVRPSRGIQLHCESGKVSVTDGPFAETKEIICGYDMLECDSLEEAVQVASAHPVARFGKIEVRAVWTL